MTFQRTAQSVTLTIFVILLASAAYPYMEGSAADFFLRLDPLAAVGTMIAAKAFIWILIPGLIILALTFILGRFFCGHICPMGSTIDFLSRIAFGKRKLPADQNNYENDRRFKAVKYVFLAVIIGAAMAGVSIVSFGSPLSLATRIYGLLFYPLLMFLLDLGLRLLTPILPIIGLQSWLYIDVPKASFDTNGLIAIFLIAVIGFAYLRPRFWCRYLCPAGALMALPTNCSVFRRRVDDKCINCGKCVRMCPMGAIKNDPKLTAFSECVMCLNCQSVCPVNAIDFGLAPQVPATVDVTRRGLLVGLTSGILAAGVFRTGIDAQKSEGLKPLKSGDPIRPPGALPENEFMDKCIRCGECMKGCLTNTLQPIWFKAGLEGIFSPALMPRLGACATNCNVCGQVCPTGAIRRLPLIEKNHAKMGTAAIDRRTCLVWERDKKCLVCDEVCPYNAIEFKPVPNLTNAPPFVDEMRCTGCGWCENKCPVHGEAAIRVNTSGQLRLASGSYVERAKELGFAFKQKSKTSEQASPGMFEGIEGVTSPADGAGKDTGLPPGFE